ncbi:MAG TPA: EAL domain-containing protein [Candidatus Rubrimentiphilum sp.]|nr:EAL domain-containing protein [Candidatus Rubrimentiphilum sp.]
MSSLPNLATVFEGAAFGIAVLDLEGAVRDSNAVFRKAYGDSSADLLRDHEADFAALLQGSRPHLEFEQQVRTASGDGMWTACSLSRLKDDRGNVRGAICLLRDVTHVKETEQRMLHDMTHDPLTGMPNRLLFESKLREQLAALQTQVPASFGVLMLDIDHFREINEGFGHDAGEFVVSQIGQRLTATMGAHDLIARVGADQFAILACSQGNSKHVEATTRHLFSALAKPLTIGTRAVYVSASVGVALGSPAYQRAEDLIRDAQIATRYAKASGGSRTAIFDAKMAVRAEERLQLSSDMRAGLERGEFFLLFQPIVRLEDGGFTGCEALLRWQHPVEGIISPTEFIPLAEELGLSTQIGRLVARLACGQIAAWRDERGLEIHMNVNVAWPDLLEAEFEQSLIAVTNEFKVKPSQLMLEITENIVLNPDGKATQVVERLRQHGFGVCIDDFGTGYSSLHYLQRFHIDAMKIDRSFICGPAEELASEPIVRALMTLADGFNVRVVAEGIETQRQRRALLAAGCRYGQGFLFSRPRSAEELAAAYPDAFGAQASCQSG